MAKPVANRPACTPYAGGAGPFSIGPRPLDRDNWIEPDDLLGPMLAEKRRHFAVRHDDVVRANKGLVAAREGLVVWLDRLAGTDLAETNPRQPARRRALSAEVYALLRLESAAKQRDRAIRVTRYSRELL